ncbi:MAG TPA: DUF4440 domain-containing protein [Edaphobacter sp.]|nr:DUF4440 domain-containing protein [Edaphobacter sp.]
MQKRWVVFSVAAMLFSAAISIPAARGAMNKDASEKIIRMEREALERWIHGDPDGVLALYDPEIVYFDPFQPQRLNGFDKVRDYYNSFRGQVQFDRYELIEPEVQIDGNMAVLTFNFVSYKGAEENRWNATEVYRLSNNQWRIIQSHWSLTQPNLAAPDKKQ